LSSHVHDGAWPGHGVHARQTWAATTASPLMNTSFSSPHARFVTAESGAGKNVSAAMA